MLHMTMPIENKKRKTEKRGLEKPKKKKDKIVRMEKKQKVAVQQPVEAGSQEAPVKSTSETCSDIDSRPLDGLKKHCGAMKKQVVESSDSEATVSVPSVNITKKRRTKRTKKESTIRGSPNLVPFLKYHLGATRSQPLGEQEKSTAGGPGGHVETIPENEGRIYEVEQVEHEESSNQTEKESATNAGSIVVRSGLEQPAQRSMKFTGTGIFTLVEIREINMGANPAQSAQPQILAFEFSTQAEQEQAAGKKTTQQDEQIEEIMMNVKNVEETEKKREQLYSVDGQQTKEQLDLEEEDQPQQSPTHSGSSFCPYSSTYTSLTGPQQVFVSSPPASLNVDIKLEEVEQVVVSLDLKVISMDSKVQSMDSKVISLDSKVEQLLNIHTFLKHDFNTYKHAFYDMVAANVASSQTSLETSLVCQFTEHQMQIFSDLDFVELQMEGLVNHLKEIGDAKKGELGQSSGPRGGPSSVPSNKKGESGYKKRRWF
ncbi:MiaB-like tRNA modifying enzyme [Dorcoceras hygrometricum]|uniref:MiaB-like tRNA modifying enzyme n=1 Tax=Dorcoceras hygrometricum TaxID=472368 RepID=A0A2Z7DFF7_9LAMI|nr:MiaB-like tRNA modifying enzyme [Dorcoceras hygrometricum]